MYLRKLMMDWQPVWIHREKKEIRKKLTTEKDVTQGFHALEGFT